MATGPAGVTPGERWSAPNEEVRKNISIIQRMSAISLKWPAPVRERSQDGGSTSGRDAVRSLFTGDVRGTAITSHRGWPVSGDVEGHTKQRLVGTGVRCTNSARSSGLLTDVTRVAVELGEEPRVQGRNALKYANTTE